MSEATEDGKIPRIQSCGAFLLRAESSNLDSFGRAFDDSPAAVIVEVSTFARLRLNI